MCTLLTRQHLPVSKANIYQPGWHYLDRVRFWTGWSWRPYQMKKKNLLCQKLCKVNILPSHSRVSRTLYQWNRADFGLRKGAAVILCHCYLGLFLGLYGTTYDMEFRIQKSPKQNISRGTWNLDWPLQECSSPAGTAYQHTCPRVQGILFVLSCWGLHQWVQGTFCWEVVLALHHLDTLRKQMGGSEADSDM